MRQAVVDFTEDTAAEWGFEAFLDAGLVDAEVLSCEGSRGVARIHVEEKPDEELLEETDTIQWWEQVSTEGTDYVYLVEGVTSADTADLDIDRFPRTEDVAFHDDGFTLTYADQQERISNELAQLQAEGIDVTLRKLQNYRIQKTPLDSLTDRQREVLEAAFENGYYDVPRQASTAALAAELGIDDSTVSEHLQRAERNLLAAVFDRSR